MTIAGSSPNTLAQPSGRCLLTRFACFRAGSEQLPVPLGDDFDGAVDDFYRGLIVNRVRRYWYPGGPSFYVGQGSVRHVLALQVRKQREINQSQRSIAARERLTVVVGLSPEVGSRDHGPAARAHVDRLERIRLRARLAHLPNSRCRPA